MVNVRSIAEMGAYVHLLEYNNIEGMILLSELSRRRIRSINKLIRVGRSECVVVIRVDMEKGYIDLSKRRVSPEEIKACEEKFAKAKAVNSILRHCAEILDYKNEDLEELYTKTAWHFDSIKYPGGSFEAFKNAVADPKILDVCGLDDETKDLLLQNIQRRMTPQAVKLRADVAVSCYDYEGIDAVKRALKSGLELSKENLEIKINLIAPPLYVMTLQTQEKEDGLALMEAALERINESITKAGGTYEIKKKPTEVTDLDEAELAKKLEELEAQNQEIEGDDDSEASGEEEEEGTAAATEEV